MITWLLLGPNAVGKTSLGPALAQALGMGFADLDALLIQDYRVADLSACVWSWGAAGFEQRSLACLARLEQSPRRWLVAVGSGSQWADQNQLALLRYPSLCLWAAPEGLWERNRQLRQDPRSFEQFRAIEYEARAALYQGALLRVDLTGLNLA
ncbi:MAG TPA: shikimate kinase, partial [Candidatus Obscuribacterales bacterium]